MADGVIVLNASLATAGREECHPQTVGLDGEVLTLAALEALVGFTYTDTLRFESASLLSDYGYWGTDVESTCEQPQCAHCLLRVRHRDEWLAVLGSRRVPPIVLWTGLMGIGAHASKEIRRGEFVAEYTGVVHLDPTPSGFDPFGCVYPSQDGCFARLSAREMGSLTRFVNHSTESPNCALFRLRSEDGMMHVCVVAIADIPEGRQLMLNLSLIHISEPTRLLSISYAVFCLKKKKNKKNRDK
eukprot:TRINITY_DN13174_c0_g1_i1.p1 TRINITY_DN13174_c0_g1~~TRINITY_DN13174_c0_g1_i1.p1  ORF type:complete len:243 (-),score=46.51 TRINITY_DN13174_c0_g1_i1:26-754(-)